MSSSDELTEVFDGVPCTDSGSFYSFEENVAAEKLDPIDSRTLVAKLHGIVNKIQGASRKADYEELRRPYIGIHKALDIRGYIAPRFRPSLTTSRLRGNNRKRDDNLISNDHQVLDLHWLFAKGYYGGSPDSSLPPRWRGIFKDELDYEMASLFAGTAGSASNKAEILRLCTSDQLELRSIQSEEVRNWWKRSRLDREHVRAAVMDEARKNPGLRDKEKRWSDGWLATRCAEFAGGPVDYWYELITGETIPPTTLSNIKKRVPRLKKYHRAALRDEC